MAFDRDYVPFSVKVGKAGYISSFTIIQIIDNHTMLVQFGSHTAIAQGWDTTNVVDDSVLIPKDAIIVTGTTNYTTVLGAKKRVYVIAPFNLRIYVKDHLPVIPADIVKIVGEDIEVGKGL
ncbi:MAG: hypothetical protein JKY95_13295 [Planctomycetaceae bacterium]|nr:hypothetical protein [Planctomycetaceae bacterium]